MATTIRQVAAAAGVSVATASRALSGSDAVIAATRQRVVRVAAELDYTPSRLARSLVTGSTGNIGVILPDITNPFYTSFLAELESTLGERDIGLLIGDSQESADREQGLVRRMSTQVDGLVLASSRMSDAQIVGATTRVPVVLANRMLDAATAVPERLSQIVIDVDPGFGAAVAHLHALGHRRLSYIDGPPRSWSGRQKRTALLRACDALGIQLSIIDTERPDFGAGREAARRIIARPAARHAGTPGRLVDGAGRLVRPGDARSPFEPSAIMAFNDQVALGVLSALREAGIDVPGRVSVVGCDDSLPDGLAWPALTTVDSSSRTLGALAAQAILDPAAQRTGSVQTRLIVRHSTGSVPGSTSQTAQPISTTPITPETTPTFSEETS